MVFKELDEKLNELQSEVAKVKSASEHIEEAKKAAQSTTNAAEKLTQEYGKHLTGIINEVDKIFKPHQKLIEASKNLVNTILAVDFPSRLDQIEKKIRLIYIIAIVVGAVSLLGFVFTMIIFFTK